MSGYHKNLIIILYRKIIYFVLYASILCIGINCGSGTDKSKNIFRYNQIGGLESLDPAFAKNLSIMWGVHFIYNTLVEVDSNLQVVPSVASSWEISADGLEYIFHLRNDVYFQDNAAFAGGKGRKMTAGDVCYSFQRLIDPATASAGAWIFNGRVNEHNPFVAVNDSTFVIHLNTPFRPMLQILTMPYCSIVPEEVTTKWGKDFRNHPCGTGPFQFYYWDEGNTLILHKNNHYWEKDEKGNSLPYLDAVQVYFNETRAVEFLLLEQGKIDFVNGIDGTMKDFVLTKKGELKSDLKKKFNLTKHLYLNTEYLGILIDTNNLLVKNSSLKFQKVRQAINYAIDRQKIVTYFRNGIGIPATKGFTPMAMPGANNFLLYGYDYNPARALQLLSEAGFPNGKNLNPITILTPEANADVCNFIAGELNDIGIIAKVEILQPGLLRQMMSQSQASVFKAQWIADYPDAETYLAVFYGGFPAPPNYTRFRNDTFDNWYEQSMKTNNDSIRYGIYAKMDSLASSYAPVVPLFYDEMLHFTQKNIAGLRSNSLNMIDIKRVTKE